MEEQTSSNTILDLSVSKSDTDNVPQQEEQEESGVEFECPSSSTNSGMSPNSPEYNPNVSCSSFTPPYKIPRPFKAYPKDPLAVVSSLAIFLSGTYSSEEYTEFRTKMLAEVQVNYTNKNMRRHTYRANSTYEDPSYLEKRRKNNEAAKRSRDARRAKEDEIAIRCAFLEQKNWKLSCEVASMKAELERLRSDNNNNNKNSTHQ